ncbi:MAG: hypothetical protein ISS92_05040 [Candidatus Omnitrophica bacterium]|nr:hypothetical protein [Candidatus Omnitrophota bacterium]
MTKRIMHDPYAQLLDKFNKGGIKYVVIGMSGINYYASRAQETFTTQDFDIFVKPTIKNVEKAILVFRKLDYSLIANKSTVNNSSIKKIVRQKNTILATDPYGIVFELILAVSGYTFNQMKEDATIFTVQKIPIKVAKLKKLLQSKKIAGRKKDKFFLERYAILLKTKKGED